MLGHWETFDYAMLLPNTNSTAASALAHRIADVLREAPLSSDLDSRSLALAFGVATVPEDCQELDKVHHRCQKSTRQSQVYPATRRAGSRNSLLRQPATFRTEIALGLARELCSRSCSGNAEGVRMRTTADVINSWAA